MSTAGTTQMIHVAEPNIGSREGQYVSEAIAAGEISGGRFVRAFEERFAAFTRTPYATTASNGTTALHLALAALDIGPGDEVIVPAMTFAATANAVHYTGAEPRFADVTPDTWTVSAETLRPRITPRTRAIVVVHLFGHPCDMDPIMELAEQHGVDVIEDAAQAHGAEYRGRRVGSIGRMGVFSFYGNKIITTGEGGMVTTADEVLLERLELLKNHGMHPDRRYYHPVIGFNHRMTNLQAAFGLAQLERIDAILARKREIAEGYRRRLDGLDGVRFAVEAPWARNVYWMFCVVLDDDLEMDREGLRDRLRERGVDTRPFFVPMPENPIYSHSPDKDIPVSSRLGRRGFYLPSGSTLTEEQLDFVADVLRSELDGG